MKFQGESEHKEVCAIEVTYALLARDCGLDMQKLPGLMWIRSWQLLVSPVLIAKVVGECRSIPLPVR